MKRYIMSGGHVVQCVDQFGVVFDKEKYLKVQPVQITTQVVVLLVACLFGERFTHQLQFQSGLNQSQTLQHKNIVRISYDLKEKYFFCRK